MSKPKDLTMPELKEVKGNMEFTKTPGQIAWELFMKGFDADWNDQPEEIKKEWEKIAQVVIDAQPCVHPFFCVSFKGVGGDPVKKVYTCSKCGKEL